MAKTGLSPTEIVTPRIYWTDGKTGSSSEHGTVGEAISSGTGLDRSLVTGTTGGADVAANGQYIYWANYGNGTIGRADLDGSHVDQQFIVASFGWGASIGGLTVNRSHIYWANVTSDEIGRADLDGHGVEDDFITGANAPDGVANSAKYLYWSNSGDDTIGRSLLDGSPNRPTLCAP